MQGAMRFTVCILAVVGASAVTLKGTPEHDLQQARAEADGPAIRKIIAQYETEHINATKAKDYLADVLSQDVEALDRAVQDPSSDYLTHAYKKAASDGVEEAKLKPARDEIAKRKDKQDREVAAQKKRAEHEAELERQAIQYGEMRSKEGLIELARKNTQQAAMMARRDADEKQYEAMLRKAEEFHVVEKQHQVDQVLNQNAIEALQKAKDRTWGHVRLEQGMNASNEIMIHDAILSADEQHYPLYEKERAEAVARKSELVHWHLEEELETGDPNEIETAIQHFNLAGVEMTKEEEEQIAAKRQKFWNISGPEHVHWVDNNDTIQEIHSFKILIEGDDDSEVTDPSFSK